MSSNNSALRNPWVITWIGIVVAVLLANFTMIYVAMNANPGLVAEDYYDRGQDYEKNLVARMARDPGWTMDIEAPVTIVVGSPALVRVEIKDKSGEPVDKEQVTFFAYRPSDASQDFSGMMQKEAPGRYWIEVAFPLKGVWDSLVSIRVGDDEYSHAKRFMVSPGQ